MLVFLQIENIAVVERAEIEPGEHFSVLTGETGAGKSIVIDAINAVLGERMPRDLIRSGEKSATVSACFSPLAPSVTAWLEENGYEPDEDGSLIIRRSLSADGKNLCRVGDRPISVSLLKNLGALLVNIHGQHDSQQLLDERSHLKYLDGFAANTAIFEDYRSKYGTLREIRRDIEKHSMGEEEKALRADALRRRIDEVESAELEVGEEEDLAARRSVLRNAQKLSDAVDEGFFALYGGDDSLGACALVKDAADALAGAVIDDPSLSELSIKLNDLKFAAEDAAEELRDLRGSYDFSPEEADEVESRLELIHGLEKRYGASVENILASLDAWKKELEEIEFSDEALQKLKKQEEKALSDAKAAADRLHKSRVVAGTALAGAVEKELAELDMPRVKFEVQIDEAEMGANGADSVRFLISANPGEAAKPISRIASGGELSRIMLAMKSVLVASDEVATLIFDEVDAGVSGRAAQRVAEKLAAIGRNRQVLCVSHLPQLAAMGDCQLLVEKNERAGRTFTSVTTLEGEAREREIARIIGGDEITDTILGSARELIDAASRYKEKL